MLKTIKTRLQLQNYGCLSGRKQTGNCRAGSNGCQGSHYEEKATWFPFVPIKNVWRLFINHGYLVDIFLIKPVYRI